MFSFVLTTVGEVIITSQVLDHVSGLRMQYVLASTKIFFSHSRYYLPTLIKTELHQLIVNVFLPPHQLLTKQSIITQGPRQELKKIFTDP
jgi:hypothetical protein